MEDTSSVSIHALKEVQCEHCDLPVITPFRNGEGKVFCCRGCRSVFEIIEKNNLQSFYQVQNDEGKPKRSVKRIQSKSFDYLASEQFLARYTSTNKNQEMSMSFFLEGVHCLACLWLIEKIPSFVDSVKFSRLNFESSVVKITLNKNSSNFSDVARALNELGYLPTPIKNDDQVQELQKREERGYLLKMGVAGACMMNIMLYSVGIYAGAQGNIESIFALISMFLCIPVISYSATPFYKSAYKSLVNGSVNIDTPLSIAILLGFFASVFNVAKGSSAHYFDSIGTLTFLILFSRYLLLKASRHTFTKRDLSSFLSGNNILRLREGKIQEVHLSLLEVGDTLIIKPGETIPCDGRITKGNSEISMAVLNGESRPRRHQVGDMVFMGTTNLGINIQVEVLALPEQSRLAEIYAQAEEYESQKSQISLLTDRVSKAFVSVVLVTSFVVLIYFSLSLSFAEGINRALALIIVSCPCALGLATPLTYSRLINLSANLGALVKSEYVLEKLSTIENIFFDKTGTLTKGSYYVAKYQVAKSAKIPFKIADIIFSMEAGSQHPVAHSLIEWCKESESKVGQVPFDSSREILGKGVEATFGSLNYEIKSIPSQEGFLKIVLMENGWELAFFLLQDQIKEESYSLIQKLKMLGHNIYISSGDQREQVQEVASELSISNWRASMNPEKKGDWIEQRDHTLFVGDGVNDTLAFSKADASIAVRGSLEVGLSSSDIYLKNCDIGLIPTLFAIAKSGNRTIKCNLTFSLFYNIAGTILAISGFIGPLEAAILMPISSLTVLASSLWGTRASQFSHLENN